MNGLECILCPAQAQAKETLPRTTAQIITNAVHAQIWRLTRFSVAW